MPSKNIQEAPSKSTEGGVERSVKNRTKTGDTHTQRARGRPKGSRNKPKALIPREMATEFLGVVKDLLPPEYYKEMREAIRSGKNISTMNEAKILLKLMGPPIWKRLIEEAQPKTVLPKGFDPDLEDEIGEQPQSGVTPFDKDLTERLKVQMNLIQLVDRLEKGDEEHNPTEKPILEVFARRGIDAARIDFITSGSGRIVGGDSDGTGRHTVEVGAIPTQVPERPVGVQDSEQVPPVGDVNDGSTGDDPQRSGEA